MTEALRSRVVSRRPDPEPCRDQDLGKFEVTGRMVRLGLVSYSQDMEF